jgi:hypothetical protein
MSGGISSPAAAARKETAVNKRTTPKSMVNNVFTSTFTCSQWFGTVLLHWRESSDNRPNFNP